MGFFSQAPGVDPTSAQQAIEAGCMLLDIRSAEEWQQFRVDGAVHISMRELGQRLGELPRDRQVIVICHSGSRSGRVVPQLINAGIDAVNLSGGLIAWARAGLPIAQG